MSSYTYHGCNIISIIYAHVPPEPSSLQLQQVQVEVQVQHPPAAIIFFRSLFAFSLLVFILFLLSLFCLLFYLSEYTHDLLILSFSRLNESLFSEARREVYCSCSFSAVSLTGRNTTFARLYLSQLWSIILSLSSN